VLMSEEFEENFVGYPVDQKQLYRDYLAVKAKREAVGEDQRVLEDA
jgi:hypothetical protein